MRRLFAPAEGELRRPLLVLIALLSIAILVEFVVITWMGILLTNTTHLLDRESDEYTVALEMEINAREQETDLLYYLRDGDEEYLVRLADDHSDFDAALAQYRTVSEGNPEQVAWVNQLEAQMAEGEGLSNKLVALARQETADLNTLYALFSEIDNLLDETIQIHRLDDREWQSVVREIEINLKGIVVSITGYHILADPALRAKYDDSWADLTGHLAKFRELAQTPEEQAWLEELVGKLEQVGALSHKLLASQDEEERLFAKYVAVLHNISEDILDEGVQPEIERERAEIALAMRRTIAMTQVGGGILGGLALVVALLGGFTLSRRAIAAHEYRRRFQLLYENMPISIWMFDRDGTLTHGNPAAFTMAGVEDPSRMVNNYNLLRDAVDLKLAHAQMERLSKGEVSRFSHVLDMTRVKYKTTRGGGDAPRHDPVCSDSRRWFGDHLRGDSRRCHREGARRRSNAPSAGGIGSHAHRRRHSAHCPNP